MTSNRLQQLISLALVLAVACLLGWLSTRYIASADWTANSRNTLTQPSLKLLSSMPDTIRIRVFIYPDKNIKRDIEARLQMYQRAKENIEIEYIDPAKQPVLAREMNVAASGEVFLEYQGRRESLRALSEQTITTALQRLAYSGERVVRLLEGHGERRADSEDQADYGAFVKELRNKGLKAEGLNLAKTAEVPADTSVLVIAGMRSTPLPGEIKMLQAYVDNGGSLLWLADPDSASGMDELAETLGVQWQHGSIIYPDYQLMGTPHPAIALTMDYPDHLITQDLFQNTVFPFAAAMKGIKESDWDQKPILTTLERSWLETGNLDEDLTFNEAEGDQIGPFMFGVAMHRKVAATPSGEEDAADEANDKNKPEKQQRAVVVGDSDFLANGYVQNLGNMQLGLNIVQWLSHSDAQISIHIPPAPDNKLQLAPWAPTFYGLAFVLVGPLLFLAIGVGRWYVRRRR